MGGADERVADLARKQCGMVSLVQARHVGVTPRQRELRLKSGAWESVLPGVYRLRGAPEDWEQQLWAAALWGGRGAAISHHSAAMLWRFDGFYRNNVAISVPARPRIPGGRLIVHCDRPLTRADATWKQGLPITRPERTLIDLAALLNEDDLERAIDSALRRNLISDWSLRRATLRLLGKGRPGTLALRAVLHRRASTLLHTDSNLEVQFLKLFAAHGLLTPATNHSFKDGADEGYTGDFVWFDQRLIVEIQSLLYHGTPRGKRRDLAKARALGAQGWRVMAFWEWDLDRPEWVAAQVRQALQR